MDKKQRGITIRGDSAMMEFTYEGKRCRETVRMPPTKTALKQLQQNRQAILYEIKMGTFDYFKHFPLSKKAKTFRKNRTDLYTIGEGLKDWFKRNETKYERSTIQGYKSAIFYHLIPQFGALAIAELSAIQVKEWLGGLKVL